MNTKIKTALLPLTLISGIIWLAGCKKTANPSLLGTWQMTTEEKVSYVNNVTVFDTVYVFPPSYMVSTFNSNGIYTNYTYNNMIDSGTYTLTGGIITWHNVIGISLMQGVYTLQNSNYLIISSFDPGSYGDTVRRSIASYTR